MDTEMNAIKKVVKKYLEYWLEELDREVDDINKGALATLKKEVQTKQLLMIDIKTFIRTELE